MSEPSRLRQAVIAARSLEDVAGRLRAELGLGEPFADPAVRHFGLRNAVFALGDTFLEVVSPVREGTAAGRMLERRGGDCGYMLMFQVADLTGARERAAALGVREVFSVEVEDMSEVHLHPADMRGAIVSLSRPRPPESWRWGGSGWPERAAPLSLAGVTVGVAQAAEVRSRWEEVVGGLPESVSVVEDPAESGPVEIRLAVSGGGPEGGAGAAPGRAVELDRVRVVVAGAGG